MLRKKTEKITYHISSAILAAVFFGAVCFSTEVFATAPDTQTPDQTVTDTTMPDTTTDDYEIPGLEEYQQEVQPETVTVQGNPDSGRSTLDQGAPADQVDIRYSGPLDDRTGQARAGNAMSEEEDQYILSRGELGYDKKTGQYLIFCGSRSISCSVPDGAILSAGSTIHYTATEGLNVAAYRNGDEIEADGYFRDSGVYTLKLSNNADRVDRSVKFTILKDRVNDLTSFRTPQGFEILSATLDGEEMTMQSTNDLQIIQDGAYSFSWSCSSIHQSFLTEFVADMTPPTLALPEVVDGKAKGEVSFTDLEEDAVIYWETERDSGTITSPEEVLEESGDYVLRVVDTAGNSTTYSFTIAVYLDVNAVMAILMIFGLLAGLGFYCYRLRKHMRVG